MPSASSIRVQRTYIHQNPLRNEREIAVFLLGAEKGARSEKYSCAPYVLQTAVMNDKGKGRTGGCMHEIIKLRVSQIDDSLLAMLGQSRVLSLHMSFLHEMFVSFLWYLSQLLIHPSVSPSCQMAYKCWISNLTVYLVGRYP
jgi:hypothetical protein